MNELTVQKQFYSVIENLLNLQGYENYLYPGREFIRFIKRTGSSFTLETLLAWRKYLIDSKKKAATVNLYLCVAKKIFKQIWKQGNFKLTVEQQVQFEDAIKNVKPVKKNADSLRADKIVSHEDMLAFYDKCIKVNAEIACMAVFMYQTACRVSEMLTLSPLDCKYIGGNLYSIRLHGKGDKERYSQISKEFLNTIKSYFGSTTLLFKRKGKRPRSRSYVSMNIKRLFTRLMGRPTISAHALRHSGATHAICNGMSLQEVQLKLGHSDSKTTMIYLHAKQDLQKDALISNLNIDWNKTKCGFSNTR